MYVKIGHAFLINADAKHMVAIFHIIMSETVLFVINTNISILETFNESSV